MRAYDIILKKRRGYELSKKEITWMIQGYVKGSLPDYQMAAFLMAIFFQGMGPEETRDFTIEMTHSGQIVDLSSIKGIKVDKHSTGGVGDKTTLVVAPLVASLGVPVVKMSGRRLGHTGGTLDKLESIPGFQVNLSQHEILKIANRIGIVISGQTTSIVPADKKLYELRDTTATVDSISLIASSICSKKLASGADAIVFDVKTGKGAFMKEQNDALYLAQLMVDIMGKSGKKSAALISDMNQPLGYAVGNYLEVIEASNTLQGKGPKDLEEICLVLGSLMLVLGGKVDNIDTARMSLVKSLKTGAAFNKFLEFIEAQGGSADIIKNGVFPSPCVKCELTVKSEKSGYIKEIDTEKIGFASMLLGAGRRTKEDSIHPLAGIVIKKKIGDPVKANEPLAILYTNCSGTLKAAFDLVMSAYEISLSKATPQAY